jgi:3-oxoacyl-[acyl-carrier-protein] synthase-3
MAYINGIDFFLPKKTLSNEDINKEHPEWSADKISAKTGIYNRHVSSEIEFTSDLGTNAALKLFRSKKINRDDIDYLIFCTQSPDFLIPTTACIVQENLKLSNNIGAIDINMGCSGYLYGLSYAKGLIESGQAENILLITSETYTKFINPLDKSNKTIFGDGATASLVSKLPKSNLSGKINKFSFYTDGSGYDKLIVRNGGTKYRNEEDQNSFDELGHFVKNDDNLFMDGKAVFEFTAFKVPPLIKKILNNHDLDIDDVGLFIFHQANIYMMNFIRKRCKIPEEKFHIYIKDTANTVSSTIPLALNDALNNQKIKKGTKVMLVGFGVGLSISGSIIHY